MENWGSDYGVFGEEGDDDDFEHRVQWWDACDAVSDAMERLQPLGDVWLCETAVRRYHRRKHVIREVPARDGQELLSSVLGDDACVFTVTVDGVTLRVTSLHGEAPTQTVTKTTIMPKSALQHEPLFMRGSMGSNAKVPLVQSIASERRVDP